MDTTVNTIPSLRRRPISPHAHPLQGCKWLDFPVMHDTRGNLSFIENNNQIPFEMTRIYFLYDIPAMSERAGHAHRNLEQVFISMSGSFDLHLDDGVESRSVHLCRSNRGYLVQPGIWRTLDNFSSHSVCLVLASLPYDEADYIRSFAEFEAMFRCDLPVDVR